MGRRPGEIVFKANVNEEFEFVLLDENASSAEQTKVRSHVMRRFRAQQALSEQQKQLGSKRQDQPDPAESQFSSPSQVASVGFDHKSKAIYEYLKQTHVSLENPVQRSEFGIAHYCLPLIVSSSVVLHVLLSITASHRMLVEGPSRDLIHAYYHNKVEALGIMNGILNGDHTRNTYEVQVAIDLLAILEHMTGYVDDTKKHMNGLKELVTTCVTELNPKDQFMSMRLFNLAQTITSSIDYALPRADQNALERVLQDVPQSFHSSIHSMLLELKYLSMTMPKNAPIKDSEHDLWLNNVDACGLNMHKILASELNGNTTPSQNPAWRAYAISGNIFLCLFLRKTCLGSSVLDYLTDSLVGALVDDKNSYPRGILLWMLFLGGAAAEGRCEQRQWFLDRLPGSLRSVKLSSWKDATDLLVVFPYTDECAVSFKRIWTELEFM